MVASFTCPDKVNIQCTCHQSGWADHGTVDCSSRELYQTPIFDFNKRTSVKKLDLKNNSLIELDPKAFAKKVRIKEIDVSYNPIGPSLPRALFREIIGLKVLRLREVGLNLQSHNALLFIEDCITLEELDLSRNFEHGVRMLPPFFVDTNVHTLKILSLSHCRIESINAHAFIGLNNLRELDLSENFLKRVPRAMNRLALLRKLSLRGNDITVIHKADFIDLHCLEELDLSVNLLGQLIAFQKGSFLGLRNSLTRLYLRDVHLAFIPRDTLADLKRLKTLDLSFNNIQIMASDAFEGKYNLESLDISSNPWLIDENMFQSVQDSLLKLTFRRVGLTNIPTIPLSKLTKLRELDVAYNRITTLTNNSLGGIKARKLYFGGNRIRYINPSAFEHYLRPIILDVSNNVLDSLDFVFQSQLCTFYGLNISRNGFLCDCQIESLINSKRVETLHGDCMLKSGQLVSLANSSMRNRIEQTCGKTERTFCFWWIAKSSTAGLSLLETVLVLTLFIQFITYLPDV